MDGGAWKAAVHGFAKSWTWLSDFTFTFHFHALEKEMATHSSVLAWRILGTAEPGRLLSTGLHRVGHDWSDLAAAAASPGIWERWYFDTNGIWHTNLIYKILSTSELYLYMLVAWMSNVPSPLDLQYCHAFVYICSCWRLCSHGVFFFPL